MKSAILAASAMPHHVAFPDAHLKATLEAIAAGHPAPKIDELLPWAYVPAAR